MPGTDSHPPPFADGCPLLAPRMGVLFPRHSALSVRLGLISKLRAKRARYDLVWQLAVLLDGPKGTGVLLLEVLPRHAGKVVVLRDMNRTAKSRAAILDRLDHEALIHESDMTGAQYRGHQGVISADQPGTPMSVGGGQLKIDDGRIDRTRDRDLYPTNALQLAPQHRPPGP